MKTHSSKIKPDYSNWRFFPWTEEFADAATPVSEDGSFDGNWKRLIDTVESEYDQSALYFGTIRMKANGLSFSVARRFWNLKAKSGVWLRV